MADPLAIVVAAIESLSDADRQTVAALLVSKGGVPLEAEPGAAPSLPRKVRAGRKQAARNGAERPGAGAARRKSADQGNADVGSGH